MAARTYRIDRGTPTFDPNIGQTGRDALSQSELMPNNDGDLTTSDGAVSFEVGDDGGVYEVKAPAVKRARDNSRFNSNLAETEPDGVLEAIARDYAEGVEQDLQSRSAFIDNYNKGVDLLGLKIEEAASGRGSRQSISKVKHSALLKACLISQAGACAELLPAAGPCRVSTVGGSSTHEDDLAKNFEDDFNYYMTDVMREYYPDTRRAMFYRAFGGSVYKKIYRHPLRRRPTSESVYLPDLIVGEDALDLSTAQRKTNEVVMWPMQVRRMMLLGGWKDVELSPSQDNPSPSREKELSSMGFSPASRRPEDKPFTFWEGYTWLIPSDYGLNEPHAPEGLPLPYRLTIEKYSKKCIALHRNWRPKDEEFREREIFVKYGLIPGLGFLDYGMIHLIGNSTRVLTTVLQIMCDRGMLANFPGGVKIKGLKTDTNELNPGLGEFVSAQLPDGCDDIRKALMGMPYGDISAIFIQLMESVAKDVEILSGTVEIEIGENRTNMTVCTMLAMVEQQTRAQSSVHRADHQAQKHELCLLRDLFVENPDDLRWLSRKGGRSWADMIEEFSDMDLVPASDPNVPSQTHRIMVNMFLMDVAKQAPMLFGPKLVKVAERVLRGIGINDADTLLLTPEQAAAAWQNSAQQGGKPQAGQAAVARAQMELPLKAAQLQVEQQKIALNQQINQREAADQAAQHEQRQQKIESDAQLAAIKLAHENAAAVAEHRRELVSLDPDPQAVAEMRRIDDQSFAALGSGAASFAKAGQTVQQGEAELAGLSAAADTPSEPSPGGSPSARPRGRPKRKTSTTGTS